MNEARPYPSPAERALIPFTAEKGVEAKKQRHARDTARRAMGDDVVEVKSWTTQLAAAAEKGEAAANAVRFTASDRADAAEKRNKQKAADARAEDVRAAEELRTKITEINNAPTARPDALAPARQIAQRIDEGRVNLEETKHQFAAVARELDAIMDELNTGNFGIQIFRDGNIRESPAAGIIDGWLQNRRRKKGGYEQKLLAFQRLKKNERLLQDTLKNVTAPPVAEPAPPLLDAQYLTELPPEPPKPGLGRERAAHLPRTTFGEVKVTGVPAADQPDAKISDTALSDTALSSLGVPLPSTTESPESRRVTPTEKFSLADLTPEDRQYENEKINRREDYDATAALDNLMRTIGLEEKDLEKMTTFYVDSADRPEKLSAMNNEQFLNFSEKFSKDYNQFKVIWSSDEKMHQRSMAIDLLLAQEVVRRGKEKQNEKQRLAA